MSEVTIGPLLRALRRTSGRSQAQQAELMSQLAGRAVTRNEISRWENESRLLTPYWQRHAAVSLCVEVDRLARAVSATRIARRRAAAAVRFGQDVTPRSDDSAAEVAGRCVSDTVVVGRSGQARVEQLVPHDTPDGRVIFVSSSRCDFLHGVGTVAAAAFAASVGESTGGAEVKPLTYFRAAHQTLIDNDNIFGPYDAIPLTERQISAIGRACGQARGSDRVELVHLRTQFAEFCGWLYQDLGDHSAAQYWADRALDWSYIAGDPQLTAFILARKSQLAGDMNDSASASGVGEAAIAAAPHRRIAAIASTFAAHGHALAGDLKSCERLYDSARELASRSDEGCEWGVWLDDSYIDVHRARSLTELRKHKEAAATFDTALASLPSDYHRDRGVYLSRAARAHAGAGDADAAADMGLRSLAIALETRSGRTATELSRLAFELSTIQTPSVKRLRECMRETISPAQDWEVLEGTTRA